MDLSAWRALGFARQVIDHRHNQLQDEWSRSAREAGVSTATEQLAHELPASDPHKQRPLQRRRDVKVVTTATEPASYCDVVTSTPRWRTPMACGGEV